MSNPTNTQLKEDCKQQTIQEQTAASVYGMTRVQCSKVVYMVYMVGLLFR
jgi:hypothetical protein